MKKTISILMALIMLFSVLSVGVTALEPSKSEVVTQYVGREELIRYAPNTELPQTAASSEAQINRFASSDPNAPYTFYAALNARQKDVYNGILNGAKPQAGFEIPLSASINFTTVLDANGDPVLPDSVVYTCIETVVGALSALMDDHPEMFWVGNFDWGYMYEGTAYTDGTADIRLVGLAVQFDLPEGYASWNAVKTAYDQMMQVAGSVQITGANRFEQLKAIHDWIAKRVDYDTEFAYATSYYATSVFLAPYITVCEGYAEAFKMLCDRAGIPCIVVVGDAGEPHAWNYVKMEDGNWYAVDVTWDDQNYENGDDLIFYDFFLRGANSTEIFFHDENEAATAFKNSHKPLGDRYGDGSIYKLSYPALAEEGYTRMLLAPNSQATVDKSNMTVYIPEGTDINDAFLIPEGYLGAIDKDPASIFQIAVPLTYGDVNGDGKVTAVDARWVLQAASGTRQLNEVQQVLANVNGDSKITAVDARWILQAASGSRTLPASDEGILVEEYQVAWLKAIKQAA